MAHRMDYDMIHRLTRSSSILREVTDKTSVPDFVKAVCDAGEEYGMMLEGVLKYYECVNGTFRKVEGPLLIRNVLADAKTDAKQHMVQISSVPPLINIDIRRDVPVSEVIGDGPMIKQCLQELIYNGLRHDENTHASVHVSAHTPTSDGRILVTFSVENHGVAIGDEQMSGLFTPFNRIHAGLVHGAGLGLGLARCKQIALALGGDLEARNGPVTTFSLTVPLRHEKELRFQPDGMAMKFTRRPRDHRVESDMTDETYVFGRQRLCETAARPSILVVDDSAIARKQFDRMLRQLDIAVDLCEGPNECLDIVKEKEYDVVCLDIIMPIMSGITCAQLIRGGSTMNSTTPIVIITADSSSETRQQCSFIADSMVLQKPAKPNVLFRTVMSSLQTPSKKEWMRRAWHAQK